MGYYGFLITVSIPSINDYFSQLYSPKMNQTEDTFNENFRLDLPDKL